MTETFSDLASRLRQGPWLWVFLATFTVIFFISVGLFIEDFTTSLLGYQMLPTAKANNWVVYLVALLPQITQVAFAYAYIDQRKPEFALLLALVFVMDTFTDVYFKSMALQSPELVVIATAESLVLYTIGSEFLMAFSLGMIYAVWTKLKRQNYGFTQSSSMVYKAPPPENIYRPRPIKKKGP